MGSPQLGAQSLHAGAACHRVRLHGGEFFILGTKSLMLIMKKCTFHSKFAFALYTADLLFALGCLFSHVLLSESSSDTESSSVMKFSAGFPSVSRGSRAGA